MSYEIPPAERFLHCSGQCRVLLDAGRVLDPEALEHARRRGLEIAPEGAPVARGDKPASGRVGIAEQPLHISIVKGRSGGLKRAASIVRSPKVKVGPTQPRRGNGRGLGWAAKPNLTIEAILERFARGMDIKRIAADLACGESTVRERVYAWREDHQAQYLALVTCQCGARKYPQSKTCARCTSRSKYEHVGRDLLDSERIAEMRRDGKTFVEIAVALGCHEDSAKRAYKRGKV